MTRPLLALLALALLAGCATIPPSTQPKVVLDNPGEAAAPISGPSPDLDPFSLVREFLYNAGNIRAARTYLTEQAQQTWPGEELPRIIADSPTYRPELSSAGVPESQDPNTKVITLTTQELGSLKPDGSYFPAVDGGEQQDRLILQRQQDNQWRIAQPPPDWLITKSRFEIAFRRVNLQFFDPGQKVLVPDPAGSPSSRARRWSAGSSTCCWPVRRRACATRSSPRWRASRRAPTSSRTATARYGST
ncbi:hypothetical protein ACFQV2_33340 [Actinokineospora soli]|uniref:Lipoprotein LpqB N-terminal domain-containing protein n=1 Tax=Actinokineospora soli TaxID=1048753 RepID=A0ABW2TWA8_9PSEU